MGHGLAMANVAQVNRMDNDRGRTIVRAASPRTHDRWMWDSDMDPDERLRHARNAVAALRGAVADLEHRVDQLEIRLARERSRSRGRRGAE